MTFLKKWYIYQKERFPILVYMLYVFCIIFGVFCASNYFGEHVQDILNGVVQDGVTSYIIKFYKMFPMFIVGLLGFLCIRIMDEFKDYDEDCKYRPYRPVPRGIITLKELEILLVICVVLQVIITIIFKANLFYLAFFWTYLLLMYKDFFIKDLNNHIVLTVLLDEILMPILVFYLASFVLEPEIYARVLVSSNFWMILLMSYIISWIVEVARKIRCKEDEEKGVKTYTAVLGIKKTILMLFILETILMILQSYILEFKNLFLIIPAYILINIFNLLFIKNKNKMASKLVEIFSNIYIIFVYLSLILLII